MITELINPLHTAEFINSQIKSQGFYDPTRMVGKTTADALEIISIAIRNPHVKVEAIEESINMAKCLYYVIEETIRTLGLKHLHVAGCNERVSVIFS